MKQTAKILSLFSRNITVSLNTEHNAFKSTIRICARINTYFIQHVRMYTYIYVCMSTEGLLLYQAKRSHQNKGETKSLSTSNNILLLVVFTRS